MSSDRGGNPRSRRWDRLGSTVSERGSPTGVAPCQIRRSCTVPGCAGPHRNTSTGRPRSASGSSPTADLRSPDAVKIVRARSPAVDRPARVAPGSARDPDGSSPGRGAAVTHVAPGARGTPGDDSRRPADRSSVEGRSEADGYGVRRIRRRPRPGRARPGGVRSRGARPASRHRGAGPAGAGRGGGPGRGVPGVGRGVCSGPGAWAGHGGVRAWSRTAGVGPAHDAHPRRGGVERPVRGRSLGGAFSCRSGWGPGQDTRPRRKPWATACARSRTPSLRNSRRAWVFTVSSER